FGMIEDDLSCIFDQLLIYHPKEFLTFKDQFAAESPITKWWKEFNILTTMLPQDCFEEQLQHIYLEKLIPRYQRDQTLKGHPILLKPLSALANYIHTNQSSITVKHIK